MNSRDDPDRIAIHEDPVAALSNNFEWKFVPFSLTLLELNAS
jgi:hypothetical protein